MTSSFQLASNMEHGAEMYHVSCIKDAATICNMTNDTSMEHELCNLLNTTERSL